MLRGDVYLVTNVPLPDRRAGRGIEPRAKYVVVLQGGPAFQNMDDRAVVIASTDRRQHRAPRPYEVLVGRAEGFEHDTIINCRWVFTLQRTEIVSGIFLTHLSPKVMEDISAALVVGLQLL